MIVFKKKLVFEITSLKTIVIIHKHKKQTKKYLMAKILFLNKKK